MADLLEDMADHVQDLEAKIEALQAEVILLRKEKGDWIEDCAFCREFGFECTRPQDERWKCLKYEKHDLERARMLAMKRKPTNG